MITFAWSPSLYFLLFLISSLHLLLSLLHLPPTHLRSHLCSALYVYPRATVFHIRFLCAFIQPGPVSPKAWTLFLFLLDGLFSFSYFFRHTRSFLLGPTLDAPVMSFAGTMISQTKCHRNTLPDPDGVFPEAIFANRYRLLNTQWRQGVADTRCGLLESMCLNVAHGGCWNVSRAAGLDEGSFLFVLKCLISTFPSCSSCPLRQFDVNCFFCHPNVCQRTLKERCFSIFQPIWCYWCDFSGLSSTFQLAANEWEAKSETFSYTNHHYSLEDYSFACLASRCEA